MTERGNEMSKFKAGDKVMLSPDSRWVEGDSKEPDSFNPLNMEGIIINEDVYSKRHKWEVKWSNDITNTYSNDDLILVVGVFVEVESSPHDIIEEQAAHIANLEEALEMVQKELIELREKVGSEGFKPISEYTMEDWEQAKEEGWVFEMGNDEVYVEGILKEFKDSRHPIEFNLLGSKQHHGTTSVKGYFYSNAPNHSRNIKRRIK